MPYVPRLATLKLRDQDFERKPKSVAEAAAFARKKIERNEARLGKNREDWEKTKKAAGEGLLMVAAVPASLIVGPVVLSVMAYRAVRERLNGVRHYSKKMEKLADRLDGEVIQAVADLSRKSTSIVLPEQKIDAPGPLNPVSWAQGKNGPVTAETLEASPGYKAFISKVDSIRRELDKEGLELGMKFDPVKTKGKDGKPAQETGKFIVRATIQKKQETAS